MNFYRYFKAFYVNMKSFFKFSVSFDVIFSQFFGHQNYHCACVTSEQTLVKNVFWPVICFAIVFHKSSSNEMTADRMIMVALP